MDDAYQTPADNTGVALTTGTSMKDPMADLKRITKSKIRHLLMISPAVGASMIQTGIGTSQSPKLWRPLLQEMVNDGEVVEQRVNTLSPHDRHQVIIVYHLATFDYLAYRTEAMRKAREASQQVEQPDQPNQQHTPEPADQHTQNQEPQTPQTPTQTAS